MSLKNIIVVGATGSAGRPILEGLLERQIEFGTISVLTHGDAADPKFDSIKQRGVKIVSAHYDNRASLVSALKDQDALVISLSAGLPNVTNVQIDLIEAAIEAGVKRVYPSEFGVDSGTPVNKGHPLLANKVIARDHIIKRAEEGKISYTFLSTGAFLEWGLANGFFGFNVIEKTALIVDDGEGESSFTHTIDLGRFLAASLIHHEVSHNKAINVESLHISGNKLLSDLEQITGSKFQVVYKTSEELALSSARKLQSGDFSGILEALQIIFNSSDKGLLAPLHNALFPEVRPQTLEDTVKTLLKL